MAPSVLIIDADEDFANQLADALRDEGIEPSVTGDGKDGLDLAHINVPSAIVLCIELPRLSGYSVCTKLKKDNVLKSVPLIITSSEATPETFEHHKKLKTRAEEYLKKPFQPAILVELLHRYLPIQPVAIDEPISEELSIEDHPPQTIGDDEAFSEEEARSMHGGAGRESPEMSAIDGLLSDLSRPAGAPSVRAGLTQSVGAPLVGFEEEDEIMTTVGFVPPQTAPTGIMREIESLRSELDATKEALARAERERNAAIAAERSMALTAAQATAGQSQIPTVASGREVVTLKKELNVKERELLELKDRLNVRERDLLTQRDRETELEGQVVQLEEERAAAEGARAVAEERIRIAEQTAQSAEQRAHAAEVKAQGAERRAVDAQGRAQVAEQRALDAEARAEEGEARANEADARAADAEARASEAETRQLEAEGRAVELEGRIVESEARGADLEGRLAESDARGAELEARGAELEARLAESEARGAELEGRLAESEARGAELEARLGEAESRLAHTELTLRTTEERAEGLESRALTAEAAVATGELQIQGLGARLAELQTVGEQQLAELGQRLDASLGREGELDSLLQSMREEAITLRDGQTERDTRIAALEELSQALRSANQVQNQDLTRMANELGAATAEAEALRQQLSANQRTIDELHDRITALEGELGGARGEAEVLRATLQEADQEREVSEGRISRAYQKIRDDEKIKGKARKAIEIALALLQESGYAPDLDGPRTSVDSQIPIESADELGVQPLELPTDEPPTGEEARP